MMSMIGKKYRTQILFEPEQHEALKEIAEEQGRSVSDVVREAVQTYIVERSEDEQRQEQLSALAKIRQDHQDMLARRDGKPISADVNKWLEQVREERGGEFIDGINDDRD
jgi:metal-responsive CopG/Arc/MetJ family transcriptional regulator